MGWKLPSWLRRKREANFWQLGLDAREVMLERISLALNGRLSADEARRMVTEKQSAASRAQLAYLQQLLEGKPAAASHAAFDIYHQAVRANRKRLARRRWRVPAPLRRVWRRLQEKMSASAQR